MVGGKTLVVAGGHNSFTSGNKSNTIDYNIDVMTILRIKGQTNTELRIGTWQCQGSSKRSLPASRAAYQSHPSATNRLWDIKTTQYLSTELIRIRLYDGLLMSR
jgi:hypothetical protein